MSLNAAEDELLTLLDALALSAEPMFVIDDRRRIVFWNRHIQHLLGYTHDEVAGRTCASALAGRDHFGNRYCGDACPIVSLAARGESVRQFRLKIKAKDERQVTLDVIVLRFVLARSRRIVLAHVVRSAVEEQPVAAEAPRPRESVDARLRGLTRREIEVLGIVAGGGSAVDIARHLGISRLTARNHIQHVFEKLEVHSKSEAVAFAYRMNLV